MDERKIDRLQYEPLVRAVMEMEYRGVISREEISRLVREPVGSDRFYRLIGKARRALEEQGKVLKTLNGQGYQLLHPDNCAEEAVRRYRIGGRSISRGARILTYARTEEMSPHALTRYREVYEKARTIHAGIQGAVVELNLLARPHPLRAACGAVSGGTGR